MGTPIEYFQLKTKEGLQVTYFLVKGTRYLKIAYLWDPFATTVGIEDMSKQNAKPYKGKIQNQ